MTDNTTANQQTALAQYSEELLPVFGAPSLLSLIHI